MKKTKDLTVYDKLVEILRHGDADQDKVIRWLIELFYTSVNKQHLAKPITR